MAQEDHLKPEVPPGLEGNQIPTEHTGPEIPQRPGEVKEKQQRMEEEEEGDWAPGSEFVPEQGMDRDIERPPLGKAKTCSTQPAGSGGSPPVDGTSTSNRGSQHTGFWVLPASPVPPVRLILPLRGAPRRENKALHRHRGRKPRDTPSGSSVPPARRYHRTIATQIPEGRGRRGQLRESPDKSRGRGQWRRARSELPHPRQAPNGAGAVSQLFGAWKRGRDREARACIRQLGRRRDNRHPFSRRGTRRGKTTGDSGLQA